jgi:hypothetical protein
MSYKVHRLEVRLRKDRDKIEAFLNDLDGEVVAIIPNVLTRVGWMTSVDFLLIVEKVA